MTAGRVLVIDDEPSILGIVRYFLEGGGYQVDAFTDPGPGLEAARKTGPFDVAVLDIVLKDTSGYEVAGQLKKVRGAENLPVLFMSSKVEMADLFLESFEGRAEFLPKPFKREELLDRVALLKGGGGRAAKRTATKSRRK